MVDDHEDYQPGEAPAAHKTTHQDGGTDEISVAGLSGVTEALLAHSLIATAHQDAPGLIETHRLVAAAHHARYTDLEAEAVADAQIALHALVVDAHHARYTDVEARAAISNIFGSDGNADADINLDTHKLINVVDGVNNQDAITLLQAANALGTHAGLATVHQDAPGLIETHRLVAGAHHVKYTNAEARASINNIFGADGKADADIDLDGHAAKTPHVVFPATQVPSADVNTLDDYEEGSWIPTKTGFTEAGGGSYILTGYYVKIGLIVYINAFINCIGGATIASVGGATSYLGSVPFSGNASFQGVLNVINPYTMVSYGQALLTGNLLFCDVWGPTGAGQGARFSGCFII